MSSSSSDRNEPATESHAAAAIQPSVTGGDNTTQGTAGMSSSSSNNSSGSHQHQLPREDSNSGGRSNIRSSTSSSNQSGGVLAAAPSIASDSDESSSDNNSCQEEDNDDSHLHYHTTKSRLNNAVHNIQQVRYKCGVIVNNETVQLIIVTFIAINAIMLGIATFDFVYGNPSVNQAFEIVDTIFLSIFTLELAMQFAYHGWRLVLDGWLVFDLVIIVLSWSFSQVQIIRAFRIFRALRLITRIAVMKNLVLALFGVIPRMLAIGLLLFLVSYIFAVMFTQLFKDLYARGKTDEDYFGSLGETFFSLFQIMTLDSWADIARQVMAVYTWAWLPFVVFVVLTGFVVVNLIIAVICDAIAALHDNEKAKLHGTYDGDGSESESEEHPALQEDVRVQLDALENHVEELTRMQEQTLLTLETLRRQIRAKKAREQQQRAFSPQEAY